ncbi:alcohol dehydrogenase [Mycolicibacter engbaekii]|uniref:Alcohol dehydrogenase n=1 Tax=Mycolicibacter engbaekii TaxID=188915 RepID=A0A1X1T511_9MYCO|nr:zinc-binding dehydrogenase [Mycolicibacter engbaekii]ORV39599.1 alcohol dehydrogenase [Mycolicibacter engbaekii]
MKAVVCQNGALSVSDLPAPRPGRGQVRLKVLRCGICGSDLHARHHSDELADVAADMGYLQSMRSTERTVFGHEFCGEILEYGPRCKRRAPVGSRVVAFPLRRAEEGIHPIGLSASAPGAYAEEVLVEESLMVPVPDALRTDIAAMTEPMAVGLHAVRRAKIRRGQIAVVIGAGPIGLAVVLMLKAQGVRTVIASDYSAARRALAKRCGADIVVDPATESPIDYVEQRRGYFTSSVAAMSLLLRATEAANTLPIPLWQAWRVLESMGVGPKAPVIFECVGVPGVLNSVITSAPIMSRIVVAGVCMGEDRLRLAMAINKELDIRFVLGYTPVEFRRTLRLLAKGKVDPTPLITATVSLAEVDGAFEALASPDDHAKILIDPTA